MFAGKLSSLKRLLEEYSAVQRKWNELEPIFAAADMQRQLQAESKLFQMVDKSLVDLQHDRYPLAGFKVFSLILLTHLLRLKM